MDGFALCVRTLRYFDKDFWHKLYEEKCIIYNEPFS